MSKKISKQMEFEDSMILMEDLSFIAGIEEPEQDREAQEVELSDLLLKAMKNCPKGRMLVVQAVIMEGVSVSNVARLMGVSPFKVSSILDKGLEDLRSKLVIEAQKVAKIPVSPSSFLS